MPVPLNPDAGFSADELEVRRAEVQHLRLRRMSQAAIAAVLQVDQSTVSRDLKWMREEWTRRYGVPAGIDPAEEIGEAVALYHDLEVSALAEYHALRNRAAERKISPMFISRQLMACLRTAAVMRQLRMNLEQDVGLVERQLGSLDVKHRVAKADDIRALLREEGILAESQGHGQRLLPAGSPEDVEGDVIAKWLKDEA